MRRRFPPWPALAFAAITPAAAGCSTHQCDSSTVSLGDRAVPLGRWRQSGGCEVGGGELIWDSSSLVEPWLPFPGERTYILNFPPMPPLPAGATADPTSVAPSALLSLSQSGGDGEPATFVQSGGQLAIFEPVSGDSPLSAIAVWNPSCALYFIRVEVRVPLLCPGPDASDGAAPTLSSADADPSGAMDGASDVLSTDAAGDAPPF